MQERSDFYLPVATGNFQTTESHIHSFLPDKRSGMNVFLKEKHLDYQPNNPWPKMVMPGKYISFFVGKIRNIG